MLPEQYEGLTPCISDIQQVWATTNLSEGFDQCSFGGGEVRGVLAAADDGTIPNLLCITGKLDSECGAEYDFISLKLLVRIVVRIVVSNFVRNLYAIL